MVFLLTQSGLCPEPRGLALLFPGGSNATIKMAVQKHCLPENCHGARVAPQRCTILHDSKGTMSVGS